MKLMIEATKVPEEHKVELRACLSGDDGKPRYLALATPASTFPSCAVDFVPDKENPSVVTIEVSDEFLEPWYKGPRE